MARNFRDTRIRLEEEAMAGSDIEAAQERERKARIKKTQIPTAKELERMPTKIAERTKDLIKAEVLVNLAQLPIAVDTAIFNSGKDLDAIESEILAENAMAEANLLAAEAYANEASAQVIEGDKIITDAFESGQFSYTDLPTVFKETVNELPQYTNAGVAAAIAALQGVGVEGLVKVMEDIRKLYPDISSDDALMLLKFDKRFNAPYLQRFAGNKMLQDKGFRMLDDKDYLATEAAFNKIFVSYGLQQFSNREKYASLIGNSISADELAGRVSTAYDRVVKGAAETRDALKRLFPELNDSDILAYALDPVNQLPALKRKVQAAEIGGAALAQNLSIGLQAAAPERVGYTNVARQGLGVEELMAQGVTLDEARKGYSAVAGVLPTAEKLSSIYGARMQQYGRLQAEQEEFMNSAEAKRRRLQLSEAEKAAFSGEAGVLKSQRRSTGGLI